MAKKRFPLGIWFIIELAILDKSDMSYRALELVKGEVGESGHKRPTYGQGLLRRNSTDEIIYL